MCKHARLGGFIVVGGNYQQPIHSHLIGTASQLNGVRSVIRANTRDDLSPVPHGIFDDLEHAFIFIISHGRVLAGGAAHH